jgi:RND family efflux transporter MFP subunit
MTGEIDIHGVFVPALLLSTIAAFALSALLRRVLAALGLYRFVWHRSLFDARHHPRRNHRRLADTDMKALFSLGRFAITAAVVAVAALVGWQLWVYYMDDPWTRDGRVRADVIGVAPDVSGLVTDVKVHDNEAVKKGQLLFRVDPDRYQLALRQATAVVASRAAARDEAAKEAQRYRSLTSIAVSQEKQQQTQAAYEQAQAAYEQAIADRDLAALNLARTQVIASADGIITNMDLRPGDYVTAGHAVMALVDQESLHVAGYFEETKLPRIRVGDPVTVHLMGESRPLSGHVESIAGGIVDRERSDQAGELANVNPTFSWVRLAQRVPVRVKLENVPDDVALVVGRTATVTVHAPGGADIGDRAAAWIKAFSREAKHQSA